MARISKKQSRLLPIPFMSKIEYCRPMGEAKHRSRSKDEILKGEARCIYCENPAATVEHMPPKCMFTKGQRLSGLEFATCLACNNGTRGADVVAAVFARLRMMPNRDDPLFREALAYRPTVIARAPGVWEEFTHPSRNRQVLRPSHGGILQPAVEVTADGPVLRGYLDAFSAKLGLALYREHTGYALPLHGTVTFSWFLNAGLSKQYADNIIRMLPAYEGLKQGKHTSVGKFGYRYNSDDKSVVASLAHFYEGLYIFSIASCMPELNNILSSWPKSKTIKPGELLTLIPPAPTRIPILG